MLENNRTEYKQKLTEHLEKEVVAFLNYIGGGIIYIGIADDGAVVGLVDVDQVQLQIKDRIKNNISPSCMGLFDVVTEIREGKPIIKIIVASGQERPYYIKKYGMSPKGAFIRNGSASDPMNEQMIENLFSKRTRNSIGKIESPNQDLKFQQLKIYYESIDKPLTEQFAKSLELVTPENKYNYAAYLMADNNTLSIKVAKYADTTRVDLIQSEEFGFCSIIKATKQVLDKIEVENKTFTKITSKERIEKRQWNTVALREAVINAMVHNDYTYELGPKFEFFSDRFEITSYGTLQQGVSKEEFFQGVSVPRSKEVMRIYRDMDLVEQLGSGIPRILKTYGETCFYFSENYTRMSFPIEKQGETVGINVGINVGTNVGTNELYELIKNNPRSNAKQLNSHFNVTSRTLERWLKELRSQNLIQFIGSKKTGGYYIVEHT
jgi:predicted HTH transcriptional regulator